MKIKPSILFTQWCLSLVLLLLVMVGKTSISQAQNGVNDFGFIATHSIATQVQSKPIKPSIPNVLLFVVEKQDKDKTIDADLVSDEPLQLDSYFKGLLVMLQTLLFQEEPVTHYPHLVQHLKSPTRLFLSLSNIRI